MHVLPFKDFSKGAFKIAFIGDLMCEERVLQSVADGVAFRYIERWLSLSDCVIGNFETTLSGDTSDYPLFSANDIFADFLKPRIDLLLTANNHSFDFGKEGVIRTGKKLKELGINNIGTYSEKQKTRIFDMSINRHEFSIVNYTQFLNEKESDIQQGFNPIKDAAELVSIYNEAAYKEIIKYAKERSELIITGIHQQTEEKTRRSNKEQRKFLRGLANEGSDVVIGSHPHYFQGGELLDGGRMIVYSLGNFFATMYSPDYPINTGCVMIMSGDGFNNIEYSFLPIGTVKDESTGYYFVIPLAPLEGGAYDFVTEEQRVKFLEELGEIRNTLKSCDLVEENLPVQLI